MTLNWELASWIIRMGQRSDVKCLGVYCSKVGNPQAGQCCVMSNETEHKAWALRSLSPDSFSDNDEIYLGNRPLSMQSSLTAARKKV